MKRTNQKQTTEQYDSINKIKLIIYQTFKQNQEMKANTYKYT